MLEYVERPRNMRDGSAGNAKRRMVFCLCADLTGSGEWLSALPSFKSAQFNVFFSQLLETYHAALDVSRQAKYEGDAWLVATDNVEEVIALCFLALDLRRTFQRRAAELLRIAEEDVPPLHLTICSGADVPVVPVSGHDWAGDSFRRAVRMSSRSRRGSILIDTPVYYLVRQDFTTKYLTAVAVKSKKRVIEETIALYELLDVQDSVKAVQEAPGIYIRGLRVLGRTDLADELIRRTTARLQEETRERPAPDRDRLLPAWNNLLASVADYNMMLPLFEALVRAGLAPNPATYSMLIGCAPDYATAKSWFDRMEQEGVQPDDSVCQALLDRAPDRPTARYWRERLEGKSAESAGSAPDDLAPSLPAEHAAAEERFEETAKVGIAPQPSGSAVSVLIRTSHGHEAGGAGVILSRHPLLILTASHVLAEIRPSSKVSLSIDGAAHRLLRVIPLLGSQAGLLSILASRGRVAVGKRTARLPESPAGLSTAQPVALELQRGGAFAMTRGEITQVTRKGDQEAVLLDIVVTEGDSGAPMFVGDRLAGICQAKGAGEPTGPAVITPIHEDSLQGIRSLVKRARTLRLAIASGLVLGVLVVGFSFLWGHIFAPRDECEQRPAVRVWLEGNRIYYSPGESILLNYSLNKPCNVRIVERLGDLQERTIAETFLHRQGADKIAARAEPGLPQRTLRVTASDACGHVASAEVTFQVGPGVFDVVGPVDQTEVNIFVDPGLEQAVRKALSKASGEIVASELAALGELDARDLHIKDLSGLENCSNLRSLNLGGNEFSDIRALAGLRNLQELWIDRNDRISALAALAALTQLVHLDLTKTRVSDISALSSLTALEMLFVGGNPIRAGSLAPLLHLSRLKVLHAWGCGLTDISALAGLASLRELHLETNKIVNIGPLRGLTNLSSLTVHDNQIAQIEALEQNGGLGPGDDIYVQNNYLDLSPGSNALRIILALRSRGANVTYNPQLTRGEGSLPARAHSLVAQVLFVDETSARLPPILDFSVNAAFADFDGDGDLDLYVANTNDTLDRLLMNDGTGRFQDVTATRLPPMNELSGNVAIGDVDGDGDLDIFLGNGDGNIVQNRLLLNDGTGHFTGATAGHLPTLLDSTSAVRLADFDGDGDLDAFVANWLPDGDQNRLLINDGRGHFVDETAARVPLRRDPTSGAAVGDIDGDGDLDIVLTNGKEGGGQRDGILINDGSGHFVDQSGARLPDSLVDSSSPILGDVDGDGDLDLFITKRVYYWGAAQDALLLNDGNGHFTDATERLPPSQDVSFRAAFGDVDNDGDLDLFVASIGGDNRLLLNDGSGRFSDCTSSCLPATGLGTLAGVFADVDGDGDLDLFVANAAGSGPTYEQNRLLVNATSYPAGGP